jgi:1-phosphatidylinositol-3-phosphate 5-kinase
MLTCPQRPTLLAKHFGCFKLTFKKTGQDKGPGKSKSTQMNLLVMENLFYDRRFTKARFLVGVTSGITEYTEYRFMT